MDEYVFSNVSQLRQCRMQYTDRPFFYSPHQFTVEYVRGVKKDRDTTLPEYYLHGRAFREEFLRPDYILQHSMGKDIRPPIPRMRAQTKENTLHSVLFEDTFKVPEDPSLYKGYGGITPIETADAKRNKLLHRDRMWRHESKNWKKGGDFEFSNTWVPADGSKTTAHDFTVEAADIPQTPVTSRPATKKE